LGAALIRVLYSQQPEEEKFKIANLQAKSIGLNIIKLFSSMIPLINFLANMAALVILALGGYYVINGRMTLGNFSAFINYLAIFIFPILLIGFMSNIIAQASAAYQRIFEVLSLPERAEVGTKLADLRGNVAVKKVSMKIDEKFVLKDISFVAEGGSKTAIIGPTAAGKTQLLYLLTGLTFPTGGVIEYDGIKISDYDVDSLHQQIGFVFQDSVIFNLTLRENIAFNATVTKENLNKAIATAELEDFVSALPEKLETVVSERGGNLSGGQKQRVMLARALALNPRVLLLDDFTARVDSITEKKILDNVQRNYPGLTLISVTQKISAVEHYDQIILLMEGELLAKGKHDDLLQTSPEYVQIFNSQRSTNHYELQSE
jgi:ATP-binding cassette subfamily B protein